MDGQSAKVNGLPKCTAHEIKSLPSLNQKLGGPNDVLETKEVNNIRRVNRNKAPFNFLTTHFRSKFSYFG